MSAEEAAQEVVVAHQERFRSWMRATSCEGIVTLEFDHAGQSTIQLDVHDARSLRYLIGRVLGDDEERVAVIARPSEAERIADAFLDAYHRAFGDEHKESLVAALQDLLMRGVIRP